MALDTGLLHVYLPIAETALDPVVLAGIGAGVGFLSGLLGVGGGFLITPLLIFLGVPPAVAAATGANIVIAPSVSGLMSHLRRRAVDLRMGALLVAGGLAGSVASVGLFGLLQGLGQVDLAISLAYVVLLGGVGTMMLVESVRALRRARAHAAPAGRGRLHQHIWLHGLPLKLRFARSRLYISALAPAGIGAAVGVLAGIMGVGGGFLLVPAMIYLLGMPTAVVVGTSLFQIIFVSANVTLLQAYANASVDVVLALLLIAGGAVGAPLGARLGARLQGAATRALMAVLVLGVAGVLGAGLVTRPADLYSLKLDVTDRGLEEGYQ